MIPDGFKYVTAREQKENYLSSGSSDTDNIVFGDIISKTINYLDGKNRKENVVIEKEIADANLILLEWARNLPYIKID